MESLWGSFRLDPREPENAPMRASDADRETLRVVLADAYADGRLTREEYDDRVGTLYASRTLGELPPLVADLVLPGGPPPAEAAIPADDLRALGARMWRKDVEESLAAFLVPAVICTVIWTAFSDGGFFWPMFPMLFLGLNLIKTVVQRESVIEREVARLEILAAQDSLAEASPDPGDPG